MKALICYFTKSGRTKKMAQAIASSLTKYEISYYPVEFVGNLKNLIELERGDLSKIEKKLQTLNAKNFDLLLFGMPTYGSKPPKAFDEIINRITNLNGKRVAVFSTALGSGKPTIKCMKDLLEKKKQK